MQKHLIPIAGCPRQPRNGIVTATSPSAVASGDASVAGLAIALERGDARAEQLAFAAACGAANCLAPSPSAIDPAVVADLRARSTVQGLD